MDTGGKVILHKSRTK